MDLEHILKTHRDHIIQESVRLLHEGLSERYKTRPIEELVAITTALIDANSIALLTNDYSQLDNVIDKPVRIRHESGFSLPEVHKGLELYRRILFPILFQEQEKEAVLEVLERLNAQTGYCISKFSDYFQFLQERALRSYAEDLEGRLLRDLRGTAVRNMVRAGVPEVVATRIKKYPEGTVPSLRTHRKKVFRWARAYPLIHQKKSMRWGWAL